MTIKEQIDEILEKLNESSEQEGRLGITIYSVEEAKNDMTKLIKETIESIEVPEKQIGSWACHPDEEEWHHINPKDVKNGFSSCTKHEFAGGSTADCSYNAAIDTFQQSINKVLESIKE